MTGYIIYYQQDGGQRLSENAGATDTSATITGLIAGATYSITMVTTSSTLPSTETTARTVTIGNKVLILLENGFHVHAFSPQEQATISLTSSPSSTIMAGDNVTLTCSVTLPTGVTGTPGLKWVGPGVTRTPADPTTSGQMTSSDLTLSDIATSQAGQHTCTATLSGSSVSSVTNVTVQSKFTSCHIVLYPRYMACISPVPVPTPSITVSNTDTLYAGTTLSLTCDFTLSTSVDTPTQTAVTWMVDGAAVDTSSGRISTDGDTLSFFPLATSDTGSYTCELIVTAPQTPVTVQGPMQSVEKDITVESTGVIHSIIFMYKLIIPLSPPAWCGCHCQPHCSSVCWY